MTHYQYPDNSRLELIEFLPQEYQNVLEIGCGTGGFKISLSQNIEIWGIEPNKSASKQAESKGYKVLNGFYDDVENQCPDHYFDLIICNDVIEHMVEHEKFLIDIKKKMKPNASILGSIPNIRYYYQLSDLLFRKNWEYQDDGVLDRTHLRFFTKKSLIATFERCDYRIEKLSGINSIKCKFTLKGIFKYLLFSLDLFEDTKFLQFAFLIKNRP